MMDIESPRVPPAYPPYSSRLYRPLRRASFRTACLLYCLAYTILVLLNLSIETSHAAQSSTLSEPLLSHETLPPEEADGILRYWKGRKKYFFVIAVNQTGVPKTGLSFAQIDGQRIVEELTRLEYQPLDKSHPLFTGPDATRTAIIASLHKNLPKPQGATLVVYFTGHGVMGIKDLWLQTDEGQMGEDQGLGVSELIGIIRRMFEGEIVLILDACYSGQATRSERLNLKDLGELTTILTSSAPAEQSFSLKPPVVPIEMSAFTHTLLQGLGPDWTEADYDGDGLLRWEELIMYATNQLRNLKETGALPNIMTPGLQGYSKGFLSYQRNQVRTWRSPYRQFYTKMEIDKIVAAPLQTAGTKTSAMPKEATLLATYLEPAPDDFYTQAVKATAEGQWETARNLFAKANEQSRERATEAGTAQLREQEKQAEIAWAQARMETYAGHYTEAFNRYHQAAKVSPPTTAELLNEIGVADIRAGKYSEAKLSLTQALQHRERDLAPDHPDVAVSLNNLGVLYYNQGQYAQAEPLYQRALQIREAAFGTSHPSVGKSLNNLAGLYKAQGQYAKAEPFYQRALQIHEASLGTAHEDVAIDLNNLAGLYKAQGQYAKAEPLYQRALQIREAAFGTSHPAVATILSNLAELYKAQRQYAEAEPFAQRALQIHEASLGTAHEDVAIDLNNLAEIYQAQGQYAEAEPLYQRALQIFEAAFGTSHPAVATTLSNLAGLHKAQRQYAKAEPFAQRALQIHEALLGAAHPDVAIDLNNLAGLYCAMKMYAEAEPLYQRSFWILFTRLGSAHPFVSKVQKNYQACLQASGQPSGDDDLLTKLLASSYAPPNASLSP